MYLLDIIINKRRQNDAIIKANIIKIKIKF